jgi:hypothetical protein
MSKPIFAFAATALALVVFAACGGNVVVDDEGAGAGGGTSSTSTSSPSTGGTTSVPIGTGASCFTTLPTGTVTQCAGGGSSGGPTAACTFVFCDSGSHNAWTAECNSNACKCFLNDVLECTCALVSMGDFCGGTPDCCLHGSQ